ncbi:MAG: ester cyclase [Solirubrobacteraceae bacterium]
MSAENEAVVRRYYEELCNDRKLEVADEIIAANFASHVPNSPPASGPEGVKATVAIYQDALDGHWDVQEMLSVGDRVVTRWVGRGKHVGEINGIPATGKEIAVDAISVHRVADGKIAEDWTVWDTLGMLQQIGAVPAAASA